MGVHFTAADLHIYVQQIIEPSSLRTYPSTASSTTASNTFSTIPPPRTQIHPTTEQTHFIATVAKIDHNVSLKTKS